MKPKHIQNMRTPKWLFDFLNKLFGPFVLDAAADRSNALCKQYYPETRSGLTHAWEDPTFCNPPFRHFGAWIDKALGEWDHARVRSVLIGPSGCSQSWFHRCLEHSDVTVIAPDCRLSFDLPNGQATRGADRDSMIYLVGYHYCGGEKIVALPIRNAADRLRRDQAVRRQART